MANTIKGKKEDYTNEGIKRDVRAYLWADAQQCGATKAVPRGGADFEEIEKACLEVSCCSEESGFIRGFKAGVAFMVECLAEQE